jgi:hypothetical protein
MREGGTQTDEDLKIRVLSPVMLTALRQPVTAPRAIRIGEFDLPSRD